MSDVPYGYCQCGCGQLAPIATVTYHKTGAIKGLPQRFVRGHSRRKVNTHLDESYDPNPGGLCLCGCGQSTPVARKNSWNLGHVKGKHIPYLRGHSHVHADGGKYARRTIGQKKVNKAGYVQVYRPDHPNAPLNGWMPEHRLVMEEVLGRYLERHEIVHHKKHDAPEDRQNNAPDNLKLASSHSDHRYKHCTPEGPRRERWSRAHDACTRCGTTTVGHAGQGLCHTCYRHAAREGAITVRRR